MRLSDEQIADIKEYFTRSIKGKISSLVNKLSTDGLDLIETIEALRQENEQLRNENASLRNWNACEEKLHNELLESDKRRWELEEEIESEKDYREGLEAIIGKLQVQVARMREALEKAREVLRKLRAYEIPGFGETCEALAEIDRAIGGKEDE